MFCDCSITAEGTCDLWITRMQKARKKYKCYECQDVINVGEIYEYLFTIYQGDINYYRTCAWCANEFNEVMAKLPYDEALAKGNLACEIHNMYCA